MLFIEVELLPVVEVPPVQVEVPPVQVEVPPVEGVAEAHVREYAVVGGKKRVRLKGGIDLGGKHICMCDNIREQYACVTI